MEQPQDQELEMVYQEPPPMDKNEPPPPEAPETPPPPVKPTVQFTPPVITDQPIREEERPADQNQLAETPPGPETRAGDPNGVDPGLTPEPGPGTGGPIEPSAPDPMTIEKEVDRQASFPGLYAYLNKNLRYPDQDREEGHEGKVFISFVVNLGGDIEDVKVSRSSGFPSLDAEALRVVRGMKGWTPAQKGGRNVRSVFKQPVTFRLNE